MLPVRGEGVALKRRPNENQTGYLFTHQNTRRSHREKTECANQSSRTGRDDMRKRGSQSGRVKRRRA